MIEKRLSTIYSRELMVFLEALKQDKRLHLSWADVGRHFGLNPGTLQVRACEQRKGKRVYRGIREKNAQRRNLRRVLEQQGMKPKEIAEMLNVSIALIYLEQYQDRQHAD